MLLQRGWVPLLKEAVLLEFIILCGPFLSFSDLCCSFCMWYFSVGEYVFFRYFLLCWLTSLLSFCFMRIFHGFLDLFQMNVCSFWLAMLMILVLKISLIMRFSSFIFFFNLWPSWSLNISPILLCPLGVTRKISGHTVIYMSRFIEREWYWKYRVSILERRKGDNPDHVQIVQDLSVQVHSMICLCRFIIWLVISGSYSDFGSASSYYDMSV